MFGHMMYCINIYYFKRERNILIYGPINECIVELCGTCSGDLRDQALSVQRYEICSSSVGKFVKYQNLSD